MDRPRFFSRTNPAPCILLIGYVLAGLVLLQFYRYQVNPDGTAYMSIARKYLNGDFLKAVNGFWSPLYSWLMVPFLAFDVSPLLAAKIINLSAGALTLIVMWSLTLRFSLSKGLRLMLLACMVPFQLASALSLISPDTLTSCLLLLYFVLLFSPRYLRHPGMGLLCGLVGGAGFLTKSYFLPFFLCHFSVMNALYFFIGGTRHRKTLFLNGIVGILVFMLISCSWSMITSYKYGQVKLLMKGSANLLLLSPKPPKIKTLGFKPPPDAMAVSVWDDPSGFDEIYHTPWSPLESLAMLKYYLKNVLWLNIKLCAQFVLNTFLLAFAIGALYILIMARRPKNLLANKELMQILLTVCIYLGGYLLVRIEPRYIMVICYLSLLLAAIALAQIFQQRGTPARMQKLIMAVFTLSLLASPVLTLKQSFREGQDLHEFAGRLATQIEAGSSIAASDNWYQSLFLTFNLQSRIFGVTDMLDADTAREELRRHDIDYFIEWETVDSRPSFLDGYSPLLQERFQGRTVTVYKYRDR